MRRLDPVSEDVLDAFEGYELAQGYADTTIRNRRSLLISSGNFTGVPLLETTTQQLRTYLGRVGVSLGTKRTEHNALRAFYAFCIEDGYLDQNPTDRLPAVRVPKGEPRPFTRSQIDAMLNSGAYKRTRAMILLGYYQGFRVSQIARVRGDDIDLVGTTIRTTAKGNKVRRLPLHPVVAELSEQMPTGWWFPARNDADSPICGASVTDLITKAKRRAGITDPRLTPHSLRHAFATHIAEAGVDVLVLQKLMLHEDLSTTQIYVAVSEERKQAGIEALASITIPAQTMRKHINFEGRTV